MALSGGGFRAAFFHIGVLAYLAEHDLLRQVEMISTVSGGSVLGAAYYLKLQALLERKPDPEITAQDYVNLVQDLESWFLERVQRNLRMLAYASPGANWDISWDEKYSRSDRLGELYDEILYRPLHEEIRRTRAERDQGVLQTESRPVRMTDLLIRPQGEPESFSPHRGNAQRRCKVPVLVINASTLNTGRHWRFEATWMGEAPEESMESAADTNAVLRGLRYREAAESRYEHFCLGKAVAASACVPGLFPPLPLTGLFKGWTPQLVDGGIHDNQGIAPLLQADCATILVSDGSGQMLDEPESKPFRFSVVRRSNEVLQDRIRDLGIAQVLSRSDGKRGAVVHLRDGIRVEQARPLIKPELVKPVSLEAVDEAGCGVDGPLQSALCRLRTDLDSFTDVEADALMASAYLICKKKLGALSSGDNRVPSAVFRFQWIIPLLTSADRQWKLLRHLEIGHERLLKPLRALTLELHAATTRPFFQWLLRRHGRDRVLGFVAVCVLLVLFQIPSLGHRLALASWPDRAIAASKDWLLASPKWKNWWAVAWLTLISIIFGLKHQRRGWAAILAGVLMMPASWIYLGLLNAPFLWAGSRKRFALSHHRAEYLAGSSGNAVPPQ